MEPVEPCAPFLTWTMVSNDVGGEDAGLDDPVEIVLCRCMPPGSELPYPHPNMHPAET